MSHKTLILTVALAASLILLPGAIYPSSAGAATQGNQEQIDGGSALITGANAASPDTPLQPPAGDQAARSRLLQALVRQLRGIETQRDQGDAYFEVTSRSNLLPAASVAAMASLINARGGIVVKPPAKGTTPEVKIRRVRWAYDGPKVRYEMKLVRAPGEDKLPADHVESAYNGTSTFIYYPAEDNGAILRGLAEPASDVEGPQLTMTKVARKPIGELLETPGATYEGSQLLDGDECRKITIPRGSGKLEIWLSPAHGWRAKRVSYTGPQTGQVTLSEVTEAEGFAEYDGQWFPTKGRYTRYYTDQSGTKDWVDSVQWRVISYKPSAPDALFTMHFPIGARVHDASGEKPKDYTVGEDEKAAMTTSGKGVK